MNKYKVPVTKIVEGYMECFAENEDEAKDFVLGNISGNHFVAEYTEWEIAPWEDAILIDQNPNADFWR